MINKQNLWFLTLFSLILVLSVYYITMPNDLLSKAVSTEEKADKQECNALTEFESVHCFIFTDSAVLRAFY